MAKKTWQDLLEEAKRLAADGKGTLYDQMVLLAKVYEDPKFTEAMAGEGTTPALHLNKVVNHAFTNFGELYAMLKEFPRRQQWEAGDLPAMRDALRAALKSRATARAVSNGEAEETEDEPDRALPVGPDQKLSWKEKYLKLEAKYQLLEERCRQQQKEINHLREILSGRSRSRRREEALA